MKNHIKWVEKSVLLESLSTPTILKQFSAFTGNLEQNSQIEFAMWNLVEIF